MSDPFPVFYSPRDIAERLGVGYRTVQRWVAQGAFGPRSELLMIGGDLRIPWSAIQAFLDRQRMPEVSQRAVELREIRTRTLTEGVRARNEGELRRKVCTQHS